MNPRTRISLFLIGVFTILTTVGIGYGADTNIVTITATVLSKGTCRFNSSTVSLDFGTLDPASPTDKLASTTLTFRCQGNGNNPITFSITGDDGRYETGPGAPRMRHETQSSEHLPYAFSFNPSSGSVPRGTDTSLTISGTIRGADYQDAYVGSYSDTIVLSISP